MKYYGEALYFERAEGKDLAVAGLIKTDLRGQSRPYNDDLGPSQQALYERLTTWMPDKWLKEGATEEAFPFSVEELRICIDIIERKIEISADAPSSPPNNINLARGYLPVMQEFVDKRSQDSPPE